MGNAHGQSKGSGDLTATIKGFPMYFHAIHSPNIEVLHNGRSAKRIESFCKGISFGSRPVAINERVYIKFAEISTSWSGVLRFGYSSNDPTYVDPGSLPRYACPDLTNRPGFWAKALPERMAEQGNILFFQVTRTGEVLYGLNDQEKGIFFAGLPATMPLWPVVDIYGNTTHMEFVDGRQLSNISSPIEDGLLRQLAGSPLGAPAPDALQTPTVQPIQPQSPALSVCYPHSPTASQSAVHQSPLPYPVSPGQSPLARGHTVHSSAALQNSLPNLGITHYSSFTFKNFPFSSVHGRNVNLSGDKTVAVRSIEEFCNAYVFTPRPFQCGERIVIQILSVDKTFEGGIAFGMTACDPKSIKIDALPDDSDLLLDRPEYWVVNKDVCTNPEVRDELSFHLTIEGEVRYGRNGHHITTLMHIDKTLPMWGFFDVYGTTQKIKCLGLAGIDRSPSGSVRMTSRNLSTGSLPTTCLSVDPPPRPPPPRPSPGSSMRSSPHESPVGARRDSNSTPPSLPPKQRTPLQTPSPSLPSTTLSDASTSGAMSLPPPLIPIPAKITPPPAPKPQFTVKSSPTKNKPQKPAIPPRHVDKSKPPPIPSRGTESPSGDNKMSHELEIEDNANNECCVCWENPPNCVVYTCGHMCMCFKCAQDIKNNQDGLCPMCRQEIKDVIKIFRS